MVSEQIICKQTSASRLLVKVDTHSVLYFDNCKIIGLAHARRQPRAKSSGASKATFHLHSKRKSAATLSMDGKAGSHACVAGPSDRLEVGRRLTCWSWTTLQASGVFKQRSANDVEEYYGSRTNAAAAIATWRLYNFTSFKHRGSITTCLNTFGSKL